jgi:hypothetical protein
VLTFIQLLVGALAEVYKKVTGKIEFIHLSVYEYLREQRDGLQKRHHVSPGVEPLQVSQPSHVEHASIAATGLNYLTFTVPGRPLSGLPGEQTDMGKIRTKFPFLEYSSWSIVPATG